MYLVHDLCHKSTREGDRTNISLEPDPTRVLRSLGQDSSPAAGTASTCTWARGGARHHRVILSASYSVRGAA